MPQRNRPSLAVRQHVRDPLTACLDADSTYICTAYNSRCYVIQKVTPPVAHQNLNPNDDTGESGKAKKNSKGQEHEVVEPEFPQPKANFSLVIPFRELERHFLIIDWGVNNVRDRSWERTEQFRGRQGPPGATSVIGRKANARNGGLLYYFTLELELLSYFEPDLLELFYTLFCSLLNGVAEPLDSYSDGGALPLGGQAPPETVVPDANQPSPIAIDQLKQMLSSQLEYYFSSQTDDYEPTSDTGRWSGHHDEKWLPHAASDGQLGHSIRPDDSISPWTAEVPLQWDVDAAERQLQSSANILRLHDRT
ncbi:unnamed protein product [Nesidiocoris tenuis]|uniref:Uncharacterized protein n=1 Tax=Nesidiocoris tenuis TaxID=355587 RepID=A0A6H5GKG6_9HEMI|nr:unnamed protein product [Nesidiocoris tenuis]